MTNHALDEVLELYVLHKLPPDQTETLEEHLLVCESCQDRLLEHERYVKATKIAAARLKSEQKGTHRVSRTPILRWLDAPARPGWAAAAALAFALAVWLIPLSRPPESYRDIPLSLTRGPELGAVAALESRQAPRLHLNLAEFPPRSSYTVEIANAAGATVFSVNTSAPQSAELVVPVDKVLPKGMYWVRLYSGGELLREYGLRLS